MSFDAKDFTLGTAKTFKTTLAGGEHTPHHAVDSSALPTGAAEQASLAAAVTALTDILAKIIVAPATEDKQDTANTVLAAVQAAVEGTLTVSGAVTGPLTDAQLRAAAVPVSGTAIDTQGYETVAASQTDQALGATGATGDYLAHLLIVPATTSPGAVSIKDGAGSAITIFTGGADSVGSLVPFSVPINAVSAVGAWSVTTGADVSVVGVGTFT